MEREHRFDTQATFAGYIVGVTTDSDKRIGHISLVLHKTHKIIEIKLNKASLEEEASHLKSLMTRLVIIETETSECNLVTSYRYIRVSK